MSSPRTSMYHVTVLSNFARGFDKYQRLYRKSAISESTYPNEFYVLPTDGLKAGVGKATRLRDKLAIPGDMLLVLEASLPAEKLAPNSRNGIGFVWPSPDLPVSGLFAIDADGRLAQPLSIEDTMARSLALHLDSFVPYCEMNPRSLSFLPIASACQAACRFCFSEASVSAVQEHATPDWEVVQGWTRSWLARRCTACRSSPAAASHAPGTASPASSSSARLPVAVRKSRPHHQRSQTRADERGRC